MSNGLEDELGDPFSNSFLQELGIDTTWSESDTTNNQPVQLPLIRSIADTLPPPPQIPHQQQGHQTIPPLDRSVYAVPRGQQQNIIRQQNQYNNFSYNQTPHYNAHHHHQQQQQGPYPPQYRYPTTQSTWSSGPGHSVRLMNMANIPPSSWPDQQQRLPQPSGQDSFRFQQPVAPSAAQLLTHIGHRNSQRMPQQMNYPYTQQTPQHPSMMTINPHHMRMPYQIQSEEETGFHHPVDIEVQQLQNKMSHLMRGLQNEDTQKQLLDLQERIRSIRARQQQAYLYHQQRNIPASMPVTTGNLNHQQNYYPSHNSTQNTLHYTPQAKMSPCQNIPDTSSIGSPRPQSANSVNTVNNNESPVSKHSVTQEINIKQGDRSPHISEINGLNGETYPALISCVSSTNSSNESNSQQNQLVSQNRNGYSTDGVPQSNYNIQQYQEKIQRNFVPQHAQHPDYRLNRPLAPYVSPQQNYNQQNVYDSSKLKQETFNSSVYHGTPRTEQTPIPSNISQFIRPRFPNAIPANSKQGPTNATMPPPQVPQRMPSSQQHVIQAAYQTPQQQQFMPNNFVANRQPSPYPMPPRPIFPQNDNGNDKVVEQKETNTIQRPNSSYNSPVPSLSPSTSLKRSPSPMYYSPAKKVKKVVKRRKNYDNDTSIYLNNPRLRFNATKNKKSNKQQSHTIKTKKRKRKGSESDEVVEESNELPANYDEDHIEKRRSARTKRTKKYVEEPQFDLSDSELYLNSDISINHVNSENYHEDELLIVDKILGSRMAKRKVERVTVNQNPSEDSPNKLLENLSEIVKPENNIKEDIDESSSKKSDNESDKTIEYSNPSTPKNIDEVEQEKEELENETSDVTTEKDVKKETICDDLENETVKDENSDSDLQKNSIKKEIPNDDLEEEKVDKLEDKCNKETIEKVDKEVEYDEIEVEEFFVKYKNYSYLHCEWRTIKELEPFDKRFVQKVKRYNLKKSQEPYMELDDDELFNPDYVEVEKVLDEMKCKDFENENVQKYLVKWRGLGYDESTWEIEADVDPIKIEQYQKLNKLPVMHKSLLIERPTAADWRQLKSSPIFKDDNTLREYQVEGVSWLLFNYYNQQNCILADEMGLGKTVQSVAFLQEIVRYGIRGPFLVIVPLSTIGNWAREFEGWTDINTVVYHGTQATRYMIQEYELYYRDAKTGKKIHDFYKFQAMVTTYEVILQEIDLLTQFEWRACIIDEAHRLKNKNCKLSEGLKYLDIEHKVLLTGTPLQNNVEELFSLLNFLEPQRFSNLSAFLIDFGDLKTENQVTKLKALLKPMMLRRLKEDVEKNLAAKEETVIEVELTNIQKKYYRAILERNFTFLSKGTLSAANVPNLMNTMMELRKCCNHPFLINGAEEQIISEYKSADPSFDELHYAMVQASGKLVLIDKLLPKLKAGDHKILIFSQMIRVLDILEDYLINKKYLYERLDGRIRGNLRQEAIDRFSKPDSDRFIFLLCTRAGGLGINLTAADTVIIFDSDWNPQNDLQAQARCHRIGQVKMVKVYRLITRNSYEREMFDRASLKLGLDKAVLQSAKDGMKEQNSLSKKEIEDLLKKGAYGAIMDDDTAADQFCEEDIDQILQRRTQVIQIEGGEKNSTFAKASFSASGNRNDIELDDPNFWQKWAKKADIETPDSNNKDNLILLQPRNRKKIHRFGNQDLIDDMSDIESTEDSELELLGFDENKKRGNRKATRLNRRLQKKDDDEDFKIDEYGDGYSRNECLKLERFLMIFGFGRWNEISERCHFKRGLTQTDCEKISIAILTYCLSQYHGDEKIKAFISDLIEGKADEKEHLVGISAPVPRGRKNKKKAEPIKEIDLSKFDDPLKLLIDENYRKHLDRHSNKILLRIRLLFYIKQVIISDEAENILSNKPLDKINISSTSCLENEKPAEWWDEDDDRSLIIGVFKYGFGRYNSMRQDSCLSFLKRCGPPDDKALAAELKEQDDFEENDQDCDSDSEVNNTISTCSKGNGENYVPLPSVNDLNARVRKLVSNYQRDFKREQVNREKSAKRLERLERAEAESKEREKQKLNARQKWSKRDEAEFYRVVSNFGLEALNSDDENSVSYNWENFKSLARLEKKFDETLNDYANGFLIMCKKISAKESYDFDVVGVEPISEERATKVLHRINLLNRIRQQVIKHEMLDERLKLCLLPSNNVELPNWYEAGIHDKCLLLATVKHGLSKTTYYCFRDDDTFLKKLACMEDENNDENSTDDDIENSTAWHNMNDVGPKYRIILNRLSDISDCIINGEWPKKSTNNSRSSTPATNDDQKCDDSNLRVHVQKRHTRNDTSEQLSVNGKSTPDSITSSSSKRKSSAASLANSQDDAAAKQLQNWLLQSQMSAAFSMFGGFDPTLALSAASVAATITTSTNTIASATKSKNSNTSLFKTDFESLSGNESITVVNRRSGKKISSSSKAPKLKNLSQWLRDHPSYDVDSSWYFVLSLPEWRLPADLENRRILDSSTMNEFAAQTALTSAGGGGNDLYGLAHLHLLAQQQALAAASYNQLLFNPFLAASMNYASLLQQPEALSSAITTTVSPSPAEDLSVKKDDLPEDLSVKRKSSKSKS